MIPNPRAIVLEPCELNSPTNYEQCLGWHVVTSYDNSRKTDLILALGPSNKAKERMMRVRAILRAVSRC